MAEPLPLAGIRILDLGQFWAGPAAGRVWADAGAEVIKIESCRRPDPIRIQARGIYPDHEPGEDHWNRSGMVNERNRNKLGVTLDLGDARGRELFLELVRVSDAVSHNFSAAVMPGLGLDYETLSAINPRIIMVSIMSQGTSGPESQYVSYGQNLEQLSGISHLSGYPDDPTSDVNLALPDPLGGMTAAFALIGALFHRELTGRGVHIDLSQREVATLVVGDALVDYSLTDELPPRLGNHERGSAPSECFPCAGEEQWIAISVRSDAEWVDLCATMERPELADDPRFRTIVARRRNRAVLDELIAEWTAHQEKRHVMATLQQQGVAAGAVLSPRELFRDPHLRGRGFWESVEDHSAGTHEYYGRGMRFSHTPVTTRAPAPALGQHNSYVLGDLLGLSDPQLDELERDGIIGTRPVLTAEGGIAGSSRWRAVAVGSGSQTLEHPDERLPRETRLA